jgi:hypothetical protein
MEHAMPKKQSERPLSEVWHTMTERQRQAFIRRQMADSKLGRYTEPDPEDKARHDRVMRRLRGRPVVGEGAKVISLTVERSLLARADAFAKKQGISRAALVAEGLESVLRKAAG